jgi:hypothetical protein
VNQPTVARGTRRTGKSDAAFHTTGEVSEELELPAHPMLFPLEPTGAPPDPPVSRKALQAALEEVRRELLAMRALLDKVLAR